MTIPTDFFRARIDAMIDMRNSLAVFPPCQTSCRSIMIAEDRIGAPSMSRNLHSIEFQEQALIKVRDRGTRSVLDVANDLHMAVGTLRKWLSKSNRTKGEVSEPEVQLPDDLAAQSWGPAQRLQALLETHTLSQAQLHAWCREKGSFEHQLKAWRDAFCSAPASDSRESKTALRELQVKHVGLQRDLRRKERALAEAAALLVLQKKFQALLGDED